MFADARAIPENATITTEICIIGTGGAGITLAREFMHLPFRVCLLESGDFNLQKDTQALYKGKSVGIPYFPLDTARLRFFGGSTNHWGGLCRPFSELDFQERDWVPHSGWPFLKAEILPYYRRALPICKLQSYEWEPKSWEDPDRSPVLPLIGDRVITRLVQETPPALRSFGHIYRNEISRAENISTYLNANVIELETNSSAAAVTRARVACLSGNKFWVAGRIIVLAAGGIENPRLLLLSDRTQKTGLGNQNDLVGRFFMDHPRFLGGVFVPADAQISTAFYQEHEERKSGARGYLALCEKLQESEQLVDVQVRLEPVYDEFYSRASESGGVRSLRSIFRALRAHTLPQNFGTHLRNVIADLDDIAVTAYKEVRFRETPIDHIDLVTRIEPAPNRDSRVSLTSERDVLGQRKVQLDWRLSAIDKHSARRALEIMGAELGRAGLGRVRIDIENDATWPSDTRGGWHLMGTTRMHDNPANGVVDGNCRVHGLSNLFIAGSSVFPTAGSGTPTLMVVALALRLAEHIRGILK